MEQEKLEKCSKCGWLTDYSCSRPIELVRNSDMYGGADMRGYHRMCHACGADDPNCNCYECCNEDAPYDPCKVQFTEDLTSRYKKR